MEAPKHSAADDEDDVVADGQAYGGQPAVVEGSRRIYHERAGQSGATGAICMGERPDTKGWPAGIRVWTDGVTGANTVSWLSLATNAAGGT